MVKQGLTDRAQQILKVLIERYLHEGQPVGSRTVADNCELALSAATVRNIMAELEDLGLLHSPHTSAGRVPTEQGLRLFVDKLLTVRHPQIEALLDAEQALNPSLDRSQLTVQASGLLANVTKLVGLVSVPKRAKLILRQIEFLPLSSGRVLVILVVNEREVENYIIQPGSTYDAAQLQQLANYLNQQFAGQEVPAIRHQLLNGLRSEQAAFDQLMQQALAMAGEALSQSEAFGATSQETFVLSGKTNLLASVKAEQLDKLKALFDAFTQKHQVLGLLDDCLKAPGVQIFIGRESGSEIFNEFSVVSAPYRVDEQPIGVLAVVGPKRMAYDRVIPLVDLTARLLGHALAKD